MSSEKNLQVERMSVKYKENAGRRDKYTENENDKEVYMKCH